MHRNRQLKQTAKDKFAFGVQICQFERQVSFAVGFNRRNKKRPEINFQPFLMFSLFLFRDYGFRAFGAVGFARQLVFFMS